MQIGTRLAELRKKYKYTQKQLASEKFFPNISKQVVILSTDEEINKEYYKIIHPYVAKEYLLTNDESINKTTIENKYFFEV